MRNIFPRIKKHFIIPHLLFWLISIILFVAVLVFTRGDFNFRNITFRLAFSILITVIFLAVAVYINFLWLIPSFFNKRRFGIFLVLELGNILLFIFLNYYVSFLFEGGTHPNFVSEFIAEFILVLIFLLVSTLLKFTRDSMTLQEVELRMKDVEKQKIEAELKALKAQVNPHFFFNTLNSLYSLSLDKSEKAPELILKLSDLMRFVIYESRDDVVSMEKQLDFMKSYVYLEQLRTDESLRIRFEVKGENLQNKVAPLLFIAFIENAFKHVSKTNQKPYIDILFNLERPNRVIFEIENSREAIPENPRSGGVGLLNVKKRLELLYPGKHRLNIIESENQYRVELMIISDL